MKQLKGADKSELYSFIEKSLEDIFHAAEQSRSEVGPVEFSLAVTEIKEAGGGIKLIVADATGKYQRQKITTLRFTIRPTKDAPPYIGMLRTKKRNPLNKALGSKSLH